MEKMQGKNVPTAAHTNVNFFRHSGLCGTTGCSLRYYLKQNGVGYSCDDKSTFAMWAQTERGSAAIFVAGLASRRPMRR